MAISQPTANAERSAHTAWAGPLASGQGTATSGIGSPAWAARTRANTTPRSAARRDMGRMTATVAWPVFEAALVDRDLVADRTMAFRFAKPADWTYRAGQFVDITLLDPPETDAEGNTRGFSISSAPHEDVIMITTRLRDTAFKRVLRTMPIGTPVKIEGPFGDLRLHHAARPAVVLTGGIGITPFRSILIETIRNGGLPYPVVVFYANRRPQDAAFLDELRELARRTRTSPSFRRCRRWRAGSPGRASEATSMPRCSSATSTA